MAVLAGRKNKVRYIETVAGSLCRRWRAGVFTTCDVGIFWGAGDIRDQGCGVRAAGSPWCMDGITAGRKIDRGGGCAAVRSNVLARGVLCDGGPLLTVPLLMLMLMLMRPRRCVLLPLPVKRGRWNVGSGASRREERGVLALRKVSSWNANRKWAIDGPAPWRGERDV